MKIKEAAAQTGLTEKAIRFYESKKLITPQTYEMNGRTFREYTEENVRTLMDIAALRRAFFSVGQIQEILCDPTRTEEIFREYRDSVCTDYAAMTPLISRLQETETPPLHSIGDIARYLQEKPDREAPPPRELRLSRSDETTESERAEAYRVFLRRQSIRDRRDSILAFSGKILRFIGIILAILVSMYVVWFALDNFRIVRDVHVTLEAVEWQEGKPETAIPRTVTLSGEIRDYLFRRDYGKLRIEITGYESPYDEFAQPFAYVSGKFGTDEWNLSIFETMMREGEAVLLEHTGRSFTNNEIGVGIIQICENNSPGSYSYDPESGKSFLLAFGITDAEMAQIIYEYSRVEDRLIYEKHMAELREKHKALET